MAVIKGDPIKLNALSSEYETFHSVIETNKQSIINDTNTANAEWEGQAHDHYNNLYNQWLGQLEQLAVLMHQMSEHLAQTATSLTNADNVDYAGGSASFSGSYR